jgi:uncharacterized membrane protein YvlD (DUF360 family)
MAIDEDKGKDKIRAAIVGELATVMARVVQLIGIPLMLVTLGWAAHTLNSGQQAITRIEQELMDRFDAIDRQENDHEARLRLLERGR